MASKNSVSVTVALVALLALAAGCQSLSGTDSVPGTEQTATTVEPVGTETDSDSNQTESNDTVGDTGAVTFFDTHERTLRAAGNVTVEQSRSVTDVNGPFDSSYNSTHAIDMARGQVLHTAYHFQGGVANQSGIRHTYRNETGAIFVRSADPGPLPINVNRTIEPLPVANESRLTYRGERTIDGVYGSVYVLDSFGALDADAYRYLHPENVTEFTVTYVVDERGYVAYQRVNRTVESGDDLVRTRERLRFKNVGSTTVSRPDWADEPVGNWTATVSK